MSTVIQHNFGGQTAFLLVGERAVRPAPKPAKKRAAARRAPSIAERIECLKEAAAACRKLAAGASTKDSHRRMNDLADRWERKADRLAEKLRGRQQSPGGLFQ